MSTRTLTQKIQHISYIHLLTGILILSVGLYLYFAFYTAYLVAATENTENNVKELRGELASLEQDYIEITKNLDILFAYEAGYTDSVASTVYITRQSRTARIEN